MKKLHSIRLAHHKGTEDLAPTLLPTPALVRIPMQMHIGAPCTPLVKPGDLVTVGQKIGDSQGFVSAPIHASVSGKVKAISTYRGANGATCPMVEIESDGEQTVCPQVYTPSLQDKTDFLAAVRESGLVGLGGASFPTHVKLAASQPIDTLVINAAECEPYITSDYRQMIDAPEDVIDGIRQVLQWLRIPRAIIGVERNKPEAIRVLTGRAKKHPEITVYPLPSRYPQGAEKVIIYNTLGRIVMEGQLPADQGVMVLNVSTVAFLSRYLRTGMPLVSRTLTVDGDAVKKPCNLTVPIGTPVGEVLAFAEYDPAKAHKLLYGGPMMGVAIPGTDEPVLKANNAILALSGEFTIPKPTACIHCGRCIAACPLDLMPTEIARAHRNKDAAALERHHVMLCMNCGCCTYACPAKRPVAEQNQLAKAYYTAQKKQERRA